MNGEQITEFKEIILKNDINEINNYYLNNNIIFNNYEDFKEIIIYGIGNKISSKIISIIVSQNNIENDWLCKLLFFTIKNNYFEVANILLNNNAKWKYFEINYYKFGLEVPSLNLKILKYLLNKKFYSIGNYRLEYLFYQLIEANNSLYNKFLETIFSHFKFNNDFILKNLLIDIYLKKSKLSNEQIQKLIMNEKEKIKINNKMYEKAVEKKNYEALRILFEYESSEDNEIQIRIINYDLLKYSILSENYDFVKKILSYRPFTYKNLNYKDLLTTAFKNSMTEETINNKNNISKLLIKSFLTNSKKIAKIDSNKLYDTQFQNLLINLAIRQKNFILVKYLIDSEDFKMTAEEINTKDINNEYPIITSITSRNLRAFKFLLNHGADPNTKNNGGRSLLSLSLTIDDLYIAEDDSNFFKCLLDQPNVHINEKDSQGIYPISKAVHQNKSELVKLLINYASNHNISLDITVKDPNGNSPLAIAIKNNNIEIIISLINYGINHNIDMNINNIIVNGHTPLIYSYKNNYLKIFEYLIEYSDVNQKDSQGNTILYYAIDNEDLDTIKKLMSIDTKIDIKSLNHAIDKTNRNIFKILLENDIILSNDNNLIIKIIKSKFIGKKYFIELLIEKGCNVNQIENNKSALIYAIEYNFSSIVELLLQNGADVNYKCRFDFTPLTFAIINNTYNKEIIYSLFEYGYNIKNVKSYDIEKIIENNDLDLLKKLVINNFDLNSIYTLTGLPDKKLSLLHLAIKYRKINILKYLIECGVHKDIFKNTSYEDIYIYNEKLNYNKSRSDYEEIKKLLDKM
ncbi:ankyrin [Neocallimastix lanati (nom. inval.)]|jgi:ankyrin repeat protein|uniref:Ankyrin n=1 Tax=Neocallimastix californiae TaxID=1754190 RepID=A0A1Y2FPK9_9FUNG|nr:ankyrin [Neocallimastix sp. JGI-2020a]ORY85908.1 ankyrin [Neocallimastix californiae]|eukprot:ORY85908.1 ankyrin [Neocallimastix californiae]